MKTGKTMAELAAEVLRQAKTKKDYVANTNVIEMVARDEPQMYVPNTGEFGINDIAHNQIAEYIKVDRRYYDRMRKQAPELLARNVNHWLRTDPEPRMLRTLDNRLRAVLSPSYNTLDNYDFVAAVMPVLEQRQLRIMSCELTDSRLYLKAVDERLFADVPVGRKMGDGSHVIFETIAPAIILSNSEVGFGRLVVETGTYTKACTNLCLWASGGMKRTHLGTRNRLTEGYDVADLEKIMSQETKRKTMEALWAQVRDVIAAAFDEKVIRARSAKLVEAGEAKIGGDPSAVIEVVADRFGFNDTEKASVFRNLIEGGSLTKYGLHAAITRASQSVESYDRATELEYIGGRVIDLTRDEWRPIAEAA